MFVYSDKFEVLAARHCPCPGTWLFTSLHEKVITGMNLGYFFMKFDPSLGPNFYRKIRFER